MPTKEKSASGIEDDLGGDGVGVGVGVDVGVGGVDTGGGDLNIEQILDVEVTVVVRFGKVEMPLHEVAQLAPGSVVELDRQPEEPVELLVNNRVFATGAVVVADGNYALRIEKILSPEDRIRSLGS